MGPSKRAQLLEGVSQPAEMTMTNMWQIEPSDSALNINNINLSKNQISLSQ